MNHLSNHCSDNDSPIIIWTNVLLIYAVTPNKAVTQKYLEPEHTQMKRDSVHASIERKLNNKEIILPYNYVIYT
nr:unnamed protein product [Callosobruchus chinensis]